MPGSDAVPDHATAYDSGPGNAPAHEIAAYDIPKRDTGRHDTPAYGDRLHEQQGCGTHRGAEVVAPVPPAGKDALGAFGEELAVRHLEGDGLEILDRNWSRREGELDVVARDGNVLVVCEVKTRSGLGFGSPLEAVTRVKAKRLRRLSARWLAEQGRHFAEVRIDVVGVIRSPGRRASLEHVRGVS